MEKHGTPGTDKLFLQHYLVGFIDLLGQKDKLARLSDLPMPQVLEGEVAELLRGTMGAVELFEKSFQLYLEAAGGTPVAPPPTMTPDRRMLLERLNVSTVSTCRLSDAVVIQVPLAGDPLTAVGNVSAALMCCATAVLSCLAAGIASRGGLDVHWAGPIGGQLYGPALYSAYTLERAAASPRVLVGDGLQRYLAAMRDMPGESQECGLVRHQAGLCATMVGEDPEDGQAILDYLGPGYRVLLGERQGHQRVAQTLLPDAYDYVLREEERLRADEKLGPRYSRLRRYLEARAPVWHRDAL